MMNCCVSFDLFLRILIMTMFQNIISYFSLYVLLWRLIIIMNYLKRTMIINIYVIQRNTIVSKNNIQIHNIYGNCEIETIIVY